MRPTTRVEEFNVRPELYNLDCVAYESVLLGLFAIWRGESSAREKINEVTVGFSRDGFHWDRPDRGRSSRCRIGQAAWNFANVQSAGGCCLIVGDTLYFYASGRQGVPGSNAPGICSTGLATLRRDGFASMDWLPDDPSAIRRRTADAARATDDAADPFRGRAPVRQRRPRGGERYASKCSIARGSRD